MSFLEILTYVIGVRLLYSYPHGPWFVKNDITGVGDMIVLCQENRQPVINLLPEDSE